ncbi:NAD(P)/FAD-dependent oxidoreductase [Salipiger abyssi]|uniref:NAD(P)/FAD-dependent oxidoreductase n=1 Tax=Salipiger abyssi TaxID=1250539 RepID=UPI004058CAF9
MHQLATVPSDTELPKSADVVVIGGGIVGACTGLFLAEAGFKVVICEKGEFGAEQSSRNWGWVRKMGRDPRELPLAIQAFEEWKGLNALTGEETGFRQQGITYFAETEEMMAKYLHWLDYAREYQLDTREISSDELKELVPGMSREFAGGLHTPSDGMAEPALVTAAVVTGARKFGALAFSRCAVRGVETEAGKLSGVVTEKGAIKCPFAVLAGGTWSTLFARNLGIRIPQLKFLANVMRTEPIAGGPEGCGSGPGFGFRKRLDGGYNVSMRSAHPVDIVPDSFRFYRDFQQALSHEKKAMRLRVSRRSFHELMVPNSWKLDAVSPFEKERILNPEPAHKILDEAKVNIGKLFPALKDIKIADRIGGQVDATPDALPIISGVDDIPGLHVATGFSGHGLGVAPGAGRMIAQMIQGKTPLVDPEPYRLSRFTDGTKIEHWPIGF